MNKMNLPLKGIIPPMITPLTKEGNIDNNGLKRLIEHLISGGVHGIFILGTNGEAPSLSYELRKELIKNACDIIDGRVPVLVGISDTCLECSLEMAKYSKDSGADAVVVAPPYYFPISQEEFIDYLEGLVPRLPLPFILYNMPSCTKLSISLETVKKARELGALGIKDSSGDLDYLRSLMTTFKDDPEFSIIVGTESYLIETLRNGGHGAIAGGANFYPRLFVDLYNATLSGNLEKVNKLQKRVLKLYDTIYNVGKYTSRITKGTKCTLSVMGICEDHMVLPLERLNAQDRKIIEQYVKEFENEKITA